jgi:molecular chaperone DnaK
MEETEKAHEWESLEAELRNEFGRLEKANNDLGNKHDEEVDELRRQTDMAIKKHDVRMGRQVLSEINSLFVGVTLIYQLVGFLRHNNSNFNDYKWKDATRARQLINQGLDIINDNPSVETLHPLVCSIIDLLDEPANKKPHF